ncbi:hypothetical protein EDC01DRAFT_791377 [Geopyxis carbonaria]|nr:hypothetical protein EDC01DRAFT_791377 [Geopyxis carbonaria]
MTSRATAIQRSSAALADAFINGTLPPAALLDTHFTAAPRITEHGPPWATAALPFLGRTFSGRRSASSTATPSTSTDATDAADTCDDYFDALGSTLALHPHAATLPADASGYVVDPHARFRDGRTLGVVMVRAHAELSAVDGDKAGQRWAEDFVFVFSDFEEGEDAKVGRMEIWADALSAWKGVGGT